MCSRKELIVWNRPPGRVEQKPAEVIIKRERSGCQPHPGTCKTAWFIHNTWGACLPRYCSYLGVNICSYFYLHSLWHLWKWWAKCDSIWGLLLPFASHFSFCKFGLQFESTALSRPSGLLDIILRRFCPLFWGSISTPTEYICLFSLPSKILISIISTMVPPHTLENITKFIL